MKKLILIIAGIIFLLLFSAIIHEALQPKPFRWDVSLKNYDRQPYGTFILFDQLNGFFPGKEVTQLDKSDFDIYQSMDQFIWQTDDYVYEEDTVLYYEDLTYQESYKPFNVLALADFFVIDELNARALLQHVYQGNNALITCYDLSPELSKYLGIRMESSNLAFKTESSLNDLFSIELMGHKYKVKPHGDRYSKIVNVPDSAEVIAKGKHGDILGLRYQVGEGSLTLFSMPIVFSNYYILKDQKEVASSLLTTLPVEDVKWTNYFRGKYRQPERSLMDYIHQQEALTWAFYLLLFSILSYFALQVRRVQRPVPVVKPPANDALKFVDTISNLYFLKRDHKVMMKKKMTYFLEWVRSTYHLDTRKIDEKFIEKLASQSGVSVENVGYVFKTYDQLIKKDKLTDLEFIRFHKLLQKFK